MMPVLILGCDVVLHTWCVHAFLCLSACIITCVACAALCVAAVPVHDVKRLAWNSSEHASCPELERTHSGPCASAHGVGGFLASVSAAQCKCVG